MAKIELFLRDGQRLGYVKRFEGRLLYGFRPCEATNFDFDEAKRLADRFNSKTYKIIIHSERVHRPDTFIEVVYDL